MKHTPEGRQRIGEAAKRRWADPEMRQRMTAAIRTAMADPAIRAASSEARRQEWADPKIRARRLAWLDDPEAKERYRTRRNHWRVQRTKEMDEALRTMRAEGVSIRVCAERLGVSFHVCRRWIAELGLPVTKWWTFWRG